MSKTTGIEDARGYTDDNNVSHIPNVRGFNEQEASESTLIIGNVRKRYHELEPDTGIDWKSFYMGWTEGRAQMLHEKSFEPTREQIERASMECVKETYLGTDYDADIPIDDIADDHVEWFVKILARLKKIIGENVR